MNEYKLFVGVDGKELFEATLQHQMNPTEESSIRLHKIYEKIHKESELTIASVYYNKNWKYLINN